MIIIAWWMINTFKYFSYLCFFSKTKFFGGTAACKLKLRPSFEIFPNLSNFRNIYNFTYFSLIMIYLF